MSGRRRVIRHGRRHDLRHFVIRETKDAHFGTKGSGTMRHGVEMGCLVRLGLGFSSVRFTVALLHFVPTYQVLESGPFFQTHHTRLGLPQFHYLLVPHA